MRKIIIIGLLLFATPALAQQQTPPVQDQLYSACSATNMQLAKMADAASAQTKQLSDDLAKAQARIKELESKQEEKK